MDMETNESSEKVETVAMECDSTSPEINPQLADEMKSKGNQAYKEKDYREAIKCYTEAIGHNPVDASYYGNRSAAHMMLNQYDLALDDARHCITIDDSFVKGHLRAAKCYMMMGNPMLSIDYYDKALLLQPRNTQAVDEKKQCLSLIHHIDKAHTSYEKKNYRDCVYHMDQCLQICSLCIKFRTLKAEALAMLGRLDESLMLCNDLLRENGNNSDAIYVKALSLYYQDATDRAHQFLQRVLRDDPDHKKAFALIKRSKQLMKKKDEGNTAFKKGSYQEAYDLYTEGLEIDPYNRITNAKLYCNRGLMAQKLGNISQAIEDCTKAIELDEKYVRAYQRRAAAYQLDEKHEECVRDWKKVLELDHTRDNQRALKDAEKQLKMSKRKDYYKILGLEKGTDSQDDIKKAYRKKAMLHHPDRHASAEPEVREAEEVKFKEVSEAYSVLSDPKKKNRYDNGHDLDELGGMDIDPSDIFASFFGGGGGGPGMFSFGTSDGGAGPFGAHFGGGGGHFGGGGHSGRGGSQFFNFSF